MKSILATLSECLGSFAWLAFASLASAQDWTPIAAPSVPWQAIASSADGNKLVAVGGRYIDFGIWSTFGVYTSADSGRTWRQTSAPSNAWVSVASSADGGKLVAVAALANPYGDSPSYWAEIGSMYTSVDSGATWTRSSSPTNVFWSCVTSSADGTKLVAAGAPHTDSSWPLFRTIYTSADSGRTWIQTSAPSNVWSWVASSADGNKLVAVTGGLYFKGDGSFIGLIYTSSDSGTNWVTTSAPSNNWASVVSSADGTKLTAVSANEVYPGNAIYTSTNSGASWIKTTVPGNRWFSIASSADGTQLVVGGDEWIYSSLDAGGTWTGFGQYDRQFYALASSVDGSKVFAASSDGLIFSRLPSPPPPPPRLSIGRFGGKLGLAWLVPSASFVLQQNSDLTTTNWTEVPTIPSLNFTNLHYEATVPKSASSGFFRLKEQ